MKCSMLRVWLSQHNGNVTWHFYLGVHLDCLVTGTLSVVPLF